MRTRVSFAFTGILIVALIAVVGFAAFSAQDGDTAADDPELAEGIGAAVPLSASGRILGAVVAAALTPEPDLGTVDEGGPDPEAAAEDAPEEATTLAETTTSTSTSTTTTSTTAPKETSTANVTPPDTTAPSIVVTSPKDGATVDERVIEFRGTTEPGATVTSGSYAADVTADGEWTIKLVLRDGRNRAYFTATDDAGNSETASVSVVYEAPATTTTSTSTSTTTTTTEPPPDTGGPRDVEEWRPLVEQYFQPELVDEALAVIKCESKGDPAAYNSRSGASGLFQFIPSTWTWASSNAGWAGASPFDPEANVASAAWLVDWSLDRGQDAWAHWSCKP